MTRRLTLRAQLDGHSGYGFIAQNTFQQLTKRGIFVTIRPTGIDEQFGTTLPMEMRSAIQRRQQIEPHELFIFTPTQVPSPGKKTIWLTMWESSILTKMLVNVLNRSDVQHLVVPCEWCRKSFVDSGIKKDITVIPLGYDPDDFWPTPVPAAGPTIFGVAGRVAHCEKRKNVQAVIDLFMATFRGVEDVRLYVKIHPDDPIKDPKDRRVKFFKDVMEPFELGNWLRSLTALVTLSRAEGYGLFPLQALACGRPVVGCAYSGHADFMSDTNSFLVPYREVPVDGVGAHGATYEGEWSDPNEKEAAKIMQAIHKKRALAIQKGAAAAATVADLTWEKSTDKLITVLENAGVWA